jgi:hypothetical protein
MFTNVGHHYKWAHLRPSYGSGYNSGYGSGYGSGWILIYG